MRHERPHEAAQGRGVGSGGSRQFAARHGPGCEEVGEVKLSGGIERARGAHHKGELPQDKRWRNDVLLGHLCASLFVATAAVESNENSSGALWCQIEASPRRLQRRARLSSPPHHLEMALLIELRACAYDVVTSGCAMDLVDEQKRDHERDQPRHKAENGRMAGDDILHVYTIPCSRRGAETGPRA
jgi:hypothetical protein